MLGTALGLYMPIAAQAGGGLTGDCDGDGRVVVSELITGVNIALGNRPIGACPPFDGNGDGAVGIDELIAGVNAALSDGTPRPRPTPSVTSSPLTATRTVTPTSPTPVCAATPLANASNVSIAGSTAGAMDTAGGASCGFGGGVGAPNAVYEYVAPAAGTYDIGTRAATFGVYLYVRDNTCASFEAELGCVDSPGDGQLSLALGAGQRIAIVVDGHSANGGSFVLDVNRRQPNLVIDALTAPSAGAAGDLVNVTAAVTNDGNAAAGPFSIDLYVARDPSGDEIVSAIPVRCPLSTGLAAGATMPCTAPNPLALPLVAPGDYWLVAAADGLLEVSESDDDDNTRSIPLALGSAPGVRLEQQLYRAQDGTIYQLVQAVPERRSTAANAYWVTTLAGSLGAVATCEIGSEMPGAPVASAVGTHQFFIGPEKRTGILRPNAFSPFFDPARGGRLELGSDAGKIEICGREDTCSGVPFFVITESGGGIPAACGTTLSEPAECLGLKALSFARADGQCGGIRTTAVSAVCDAAPEDGFELHAGEAVVFVHALGRAAVELGVGAFGAADGEGDDLCPGVIEPRAARGALAHAPLLALVDVLRGAEAQLIALSPDAEGRHAYVVADGFLHAFQRSAADGSLELIQDLRQGVGGVQGLDAPSFIGVSPDGRHVYVAGSAGVVVFARNQVSGALSFVQLHRGLVCDGDDFPRDGCMVLSPDGRNAYLVRDGAVVMLARDEQRGTLAPLGEVEVIGGFGYTFALSPDGGHLYVQGSGMVAAYTRSPDTGELSFLESHPGEGFLLISPDDGGRHLYLLESDRISIFARNPANGRLTPGTPIPLALDLVPPARFTPDGQRIVAASSDSGAAIIRTLLRDSASGDLTAGASIADVFPGVAAARSIAVSPDGRFVYATSDADLILTVLAIADDGTLRVVTTQEGVGGQLSGTLGIALSPDGRHVYSGSFLDEAVVVTRRDPATGRLTFLESKREGIDGVVGLFEPTGVTVTQDGRHVYVGDSGRHTLLVFGRDAETGQLQFVEVHADRDPPPVPRPMPTPPGAIEAQGLDFPSDIDVSPDPDGRHVYVSSGAIFSRMKEDGRLQFIDTHPIYFGQLVLDSDGDRVYASGQDGVTVLSRDPLTGLLETIGTASVPGDSATSVSISKDDRHLYAGVSGEAAGVALFDRDDDGTLAFVESAEISPAKINEPFVVVSPDGRYVFVAGIDNRIAVFSRASDTGRLTLQEVQDEGLDTIPFVPRLVVSPDSLNVYAPTERGIAAFKVPE